MSNNDYEEDYYEEDDDDEYYGAIVNYEKLGLPWLSEPLIAPVRFYVEGKLDGDIKWNNIDAKIQLQIPYRESNRAEYERYQKDYGTFVNPYEYNFSCHILPFTHNCGAKAIQDIIGELKNNNEEMKLFLTYVESFLWHKCNVGILLGSDCKEKSGHQGFTGKAIETAGVGYNFTPLVWNPNYMWDSEHKIFLFYKHLGDYVHTDYWS